MSQFVVFNTDKQSFNFLECDNGKLQMENNKPVIKPLNTVKHVYNDSSGIRVVIPKNVPYTLYSYTGFFKANGFVQFKIHDIVQDNNVEWFVKFLVVAEDLITRDEKTVHTFTYNINNKVNPYVILPICYCTHKGLNETNIYHLKLICNVDTEYSGSESSIIIEPV